MSVTESPKFGEPYLPEGTFVIFSFDPVAYAAQLEDDVAMQTARAIPRKKYLGLIESLGPLDLPELRLNFNIRVAGRAQPQEGEDDMYSTSPARCIPIHPTTSHPEGRPPLVPSAPLPWQEDCYLHTLQLVNAFVSRVHHTKTALTTVTQEEMARVGHHVAADEYEATPSRSQQNAVQDNDDEESEASTGSIYSSGDDGSRSSSVDEPFIRPLGVYVEIWEDLSTAETLGEPKNVTADIDEIAAIGEEWEKRKNYEFRAKAPLTSQWAEGVANSIHEGQDRVLSEDAPYSVHDDELGPEDAIDERIEKARLCGVGMQVTANETADKATSGTPGATPMPAAPGSPVASSALGCASTNKTAGDDGSVYRRGPLQFATAKARHLKEWLKQTLRM